MSKQLLAKVLHTRATNYKSSKDKTIKNRKQKEYIQSLLCYHYIISAHVSFLSFVFLLRNIGDLIKLLVLNKCVFWGSLRFSDVLIQRYKNCFTVFSRFPVLTTKYVQVWIILCIFISSDIYPSLGKCSITAGRHELFSSICQFFSQHSADKWLQNLLGSHESNCKKKHIYWKVFMML